ncbi:MAG: TIR domain-containing protein [Eudoraea sp.]|uniref:toll/interleukin-1 receptor domain-containing protein n=1 Tax=Eudoraea sp. TaxID=1979955 RepID=UPI003267393E
METELATKYEDLEEIIEYINNGTCLVILGPNLLKDNDGNSINDKLNNYLTTKLPRKVTQTENEGFLSFDDKTRDIKIEAPIKKFFEEALPSNDIYENLAEIPFPLIINTSPDKTLNKVFDKKGKGYDYGFYHKKETPQSRIKKYNTQIYNIFGDYEHINSMILTYKDLFEYLESIMGTKELKLKDQLKEFKVVLFLGFSFEKWYFQLLLWIMKVDNKGLHSHLIDQENLMKFCEDEFDVEFYDDKKAAEIIEGLCMAKSQGLIEDKENTYQPELFISYAWGKESDKITESLKKRLLEENLRVLIDKDNLAYKADIPDFMKRIGKTDGAVVVISKKYLESINCMRELLELHKTYKNEEFLTRIFPICLEDANFFDRKELLKYEQKWIVKKEDLDKQYQEIGQSAGKVLDEDYDFIKEIIENFTDITLILRKINLSSSQKMKDTNFKVLIEDIKKVF